MEILGPNFLPIVLNIALALVAVSILLLVIVTGVHWQTDRQLQRITAFDQAFRPAVTGYLEGQTTEESITRLMHADPVEALRVLIHVSQNLRPSVRSRLKPLFSKLIHVDDEVAALGSYSVHRRILATERLGYVKDEKASEALINVLDDEVPAIRLSAARSLAAHDKTEAIEHILNSLDLPEELIELREVEAIFDYGPSAVPALLSVLENADGSHSSNAMVVAARVLGMLQSQEAVPQLIHLLESPIRNIRLNAAHALGEIGDQQAIPALVAIANDVSSEVRRKVIRSLGQLQATGEISVLSQALHDSSWWVRSAAAQALHSLGSPGITELHHVMETTGNPDAQEICHEVLEEHNILDTKKVSL